MASAMVIISRLKFVVPLLVICLCGHVNAAVKCQSGGKKLTLDDAYGCREELAKKKFETCVQENFDIPPPEGHDFGYGCTILASRGHAVVSICGPRGVEQPCEKLGDDLDTLVSTCASRDRYDDGLVPPGSIDYADWPYFAEAVLKLEYKSEELFSSTEVLKQIVT